MEIDVKKYFLAEGNYRITVRLYEGSDLLPPT